MANGRVRATQHGPRLDRLQIVLDTQDSVRYDDATTVAVEPAAG
jgi:hypothetical protein